MPILSHPQERHITPTVEERQYAIQYPFVLLSSDIRIRFAPDSLNVQRWGTDSGDQFAPDHPIVAGGIVGGHHSLVNEDQVHPPEIHWSGYEQIAQTAVDSPGSPSTRQRNQTFAPFMKSPPDRFDNSMRRHDLTIVLGGQYIHARLVHSDAHFCSHSEWLCIQG
jgi:hypothetical protein